MPIFCIFFWYKALITPFRVKIIDNNQIVFRAIFKTTVLFPDDILKIEDSVFSYKIIHKNGQISISSLMNNPYGLKKTLESLNSEIESEDVTSNSLKKAEKIEPLILFGFWIC